jgi:hypothetical protein
VGENFFSKTVFFFRSEWFPGIRLEPESAQFHSTAPESEWTSERSAPAVATLKKCVADRSRAAVLAGTVFWK